MDEHTSQTRLCGHDNEAQSFIGMAASQRLHHAWLLTGQKGIGKATFAWQAAAYLLSGAHTQTTLLGGSDPLEALFTAAISQPAGQMRAGSHPDFRSITPDPSKAKAQISVEQIRDMAGMFVTTAGMGGWRIAIIDAAEDMNRNAANAILKLLEEPPRQCLFFLISHAPGRLLPTIRSRCSCLAFKPLSQHEATRVVQDAQPDMDGVELETVMALAQGSPGRALELLASNAADYVIAVDQLFIGLPQIDRQSLHGLADLMGDRASSDVFEVVWDLIEDRIRFAVKAVATNAPGNPWTAALRLDQWIALQETLSDRKGQTIGLNLSPRQVLISLFADVGQMLQRAA